MTIEEALEECCDTDTLRLNLCIACCANDWYCGSYCDELEKAGRIPFEKLIKSYARNDGDLVKVIRYIRRYKEK
jgi:hypothetical protein